MVLITGPWDSLADRAERGELPPLVRLRHGVIRLFSSPPEQPDVVVSSPFSTLPYSPEERWKLLRFFPDSDFPIYALSRGIECLRISEGRKPTSLTPVESELLREALTHIDDKTLYP